MLFTLTKLPKVEGVSVLKARFQVPPSDELTDEVFAAFKLRWRNIYRARKGERFAFVIDLTDPSMRSFAMMWVLPYVVDVLKETRPMAEELLVTTVIITGMCGRALIASVNAVYPLLPYETVSSPSEVEQVVAVKCIEQRRRR